MPKDQRALLMEPQRIEFGPAEHRQLAPLEVRVRMRAATMCGTDVSYFMTGRSGSYTMELPFVLGHEGAGTIVEVGSGVERARVGSDIAINPANPCRRCTFCTTYGRSNLCENMRYLGSASSNPPVDGLFSRHVVLGASQCLAIPSNLPLIQAPLVEPASVAMHAVNRSNLQAGDDALIIGAGAIGLLIMRIAQAVGVRSISVVDPSERRRVHARIEGALSAVSPLEISELLTPGVVFECSGTSAGLNQAIEKVRRGGVVVQVGGIREPTSVPAQLVMSRELTILGSFRFAEEPTQVVGLIEAGRLSLAGLIESEWPFEEIDHALRAAASGDFVKVAINFD